MKKLKAIWIIFPSRILKEIENLQQFIARRDASRMLIKLWKKLFFLSTRLLAEHFMGST